MCVESLGGNCSVRDGGDVVVLFDRGECWEKGTATESAMDLFLGWKRWAGWRRVGEETSTETTWTAEAAVVLRSGSVGATSVG